MDRRKFLKTLAVTGAATLIDFSPLKSLLAQGQTGVSKADDLVAVMGGEPDAMLRRAMAELGGIERFVKRGNRVVLKPNIGWDRPADRGANTNPLLMATMVKMCLDAGASEVQVFDHTCDDWIRTYANSGIKKAVEDAGGKMLPANTENYYVDYNLPNGVRLKKIKLHQAIANCDVWFNMPVLKHHGGAKMTASMKNLMGIVWDRGAFHSNDLQQCIADACTLAKQPALNIVDAYRVIKDNGPQGRTAADTVTLKTLIVSPDIVAADSASLKFFAQVRNVTEDEVSHIGKGQELKLGTTDIDAMNVKRIRM
ncbi:MAG: DUF362 domain-containing protein [Rikenellaceae bacterium]|jgi:uncharacterized protein (DUF362 family)|nr:DUF362 domain-containing protein [Rikenellaceae bacterium]